MSFQANFDAMDVSHTGKLSTEQLREILVKLGGVSSHEEMQKMLALADKKGLGEIDYAAFAEIMNHS